MLQVMSFGLKNVRATYQRLVNTMLEELIGKTMEVYVDDMLVKLEWIVDHISNFGEMFRVLRNYRMKLNPFKCAFGVASEKFMGFMVNNRGIKVNPEKIRVLLNMKSPV